LTRKSTTSIQGKGLPPGRIDMVWEEKLEEHEFNTVNLSNSTLPIKISLFLDGSPAEKELDIRGLHFQ